MAKNIEKGKNVKSTLRELEYDKKTEKRGKFDTNTFGPGIWRETLKTWKMRNEHSRTWNMARKMKNLENERKKAV